MVDCAEAFTASVEGVVLEGGAFLSGILKQCLSFGALICCLGYDLAGHFHRAGHTEQIHMVQKWQESSFLREKVLVFFHLRI